MVAYNQGRFWIDRGPEGRTLRYDLQSLHAFLFCLFVTAMFFIIALAGDGIVAALTIAVIAFGWLYGLNLLQSLIRVPPLIRRSAGGE